MINPGLLLKSKYFEYAFWAGISFVIGWGIYRIILVGFWIPESRMESLSVVLVMSLLLFIFFLVFIRSGWVDRTGFGGPFRELVEGHPVLFRALLIAFPVILFNLANVFGPRFLVNDDPLRYWQGINILETLHNGLAEFDLFSIPERIFWGVMAHFSTYVARLVYLLFYLTGISFCMYWISRKIFNLTAPCAYLAAVLPAVFPLQHQIIAGINVSYTLLGQLLVLVGLICGFCYLTREKHSWVLVVSAGILFASATRIMEQAVFLSAAVGLIYLVTSKYVLRKVLLLVPVAVSSAAALYEMVFYPRGPAIAQDIPGEVILFRTLKFLAYLSPAIEENSFILILFLLVAGMGSLLIWPLMKERVSGLPHFSWIPQNLRYWILPAFVFAWTFFSVFPFIALNSQMTVRMIHYAGYGPWMVMAPGLAFLFWLVPFRIPVKRRMLIFIVFMIIVVSGIEHMNHAMKNYAGPNYHWDGLSSTVSYHAFPLDSQIVITGADMGTYSSHYICTGYLSRLLNNRRDVSGLVGNEYFYYDPFSRADLWSSRMTGLRGTSNLHLFRFRIDGEIHPSEYLEQYRYFLRVITKESVFREGQEPGDWCLYKFDETGIAAIKYTGNGLDQYKELLGKLEKEGIKPEHICWGDPADKFGCNSPFGE